MGQTGSERDTGFGGLLRGLREGAGLSQEELARRAGLSANAIGSLERGVRRRPHPHTVRALADALDLPEARRADLVGAVREADTPVESVEAEPGGALPVPATGLVGRETEVEAVAGMLGGARLVTLTGPGGVGKTRLALAAAGRAETTFSDGVAFVALAAVGDPTLVLPTVAGALGIKMQGGITALVALRSGLAGRRALILLDNFEHLMDAATDVAGLLAVCPDLTVLATSREALRIGGEQRFPVPPLPVPDLARVPGPEEVEASAAGRLFVRRAGEANPGFVLDRRNAAAVAAICRRLDGLPLALELAAARTSMLSPRMLLARLDDALPLLAGGSRDLPERQRTMRQTIAWSHGLLDDAEKVAFRRLAVFSGGFALEAAEAVCADGDASPWATFETLSSLLDKSLVATAGAFDEPRYRMLETVRAYGLERLAASGEEEGVRARHARFYLRVAEEIEPHGNTPERAGWLGRLERELDNLRAALSWSVGGGDPGGDPETGLRLAGALFWLWFHRGYWTEGRRWMEEALAGDDPVGTLPTLGRAKNLAGAGGIACSQGDYVNAYPMLEEAAELWHELGEEPAVSHAALYLYVAVFGLGEVERAEKLARESLAVFRARGDAFGQGSNLTFLGLLYLLRDDHATARSLFEEAVGVAGRLGDDWLQMLPMRNLGLVALKQGDFAEAERWLREGLRGLRKLEEQWLVARTIEYIAQASAARRDPARAARLFGAAEAMRETVRSFQEPEDRADYELALATAREGLGGEAFDAAWEEGRAMSYAEAIAFALDEEADVNRKPRSYNPG